MVPPADLPDSSTHFPAFSSSSKWSSMNCRAWLSLIVSSHRWPMASLSSSDNSALSSSFERASETLLHEATCSLYVWILRLRVTDSKAKLQVARGLVHRSVATPLLWRIVDQSGACGEAYVHSGRRARRKLFNRNLSAIVLSCSRRYASLLLQ